MTQMASLVFDFLIRCNSVWERELIGFMPSWLVVHYNCWCLVLHVCVREREHFMVSVHYNCWCLILHLSVIDLNRCQIRKLILHEPYYCTNVTTFCPTCNFIKFQALAKIHPVTFTFIKYVIPCQLCAESPFVF